MNCVIKGIIQRNYKKMTMKWSFSYNFYGNFFLIISLYNSLVRKILEPQHDNVTVKPA